MGFIELYNLFARNATINASASEAFGQDVSSRENKHKYGSFNSAVITIQNTAGATVRLDGLANKVFRINQPGTFKIKADEGYFFDWVDIVDHSGNGITADLVDIKLAIAKEVQ